MLRSNEEIKARLQYSKAILIHFMSYVWLRAQIPPKALWFGEKNNIFDTKNLISRYFTTFQYPNHLDQQKMNKIQIYSYGEIQAKQI